MTLQPTTIRDEQLYTLWDYYGAFTEYSINDNFAIKDEDKDLDDKEDGKVVTDEFDDEESEDNHGESYE